MSRKDYIALARVLHENYVDLKIRPNCADAILPFDAMTSKICSVLRADNVNFDADKFRKVIYSVK